MTVKNGSIDKHYVIINRWKLKISTSKEKRALPIVFISRVPFWIDNNLHSWESATKDFFVKALLAWKQARSS